ncbi:MAG: prepilin-type N-terminal cleavage/methylation domain-containing protein [Candidatus Riflebacteria bacterium]|nr:prepilin-type N-terminal cleavage/methylation domain-containing protein [Candidatus Riflebacteria bacterium]
MQSPRSLCRSIQKPGLRVFSSIIIRPGYTIIEVLIAASILAMLFGGIYQIFSSVKRTHEMAAWTSSTTTTIRNGLSLMRGEITRISCPSKITQAGMEFIDTTLAQNKLYIAGNPQTVLFPPGGDARLLHFYMCKPGREGIVGEADIGFEIMEGILEIKGSKIVYSRNIITNTNVPADQQTQPLSTVICANPASITLSLSMAAVQASVSVKLRNFVNISIEAQHPKYPSTHVTEVIEAPFEVDAQVGGL